MTNLSAIRITCQELQDKFNNNEGGYPAKINTLTSALIYDQPASPKSHQPPGTMRLPSGKLGASGKMDPKRLLVEGVYYYCD